MIPRMKYIFLLGFVVGIFGVVAQPVLAEEVVSSFDARVVVHENATIEVTERIVYDFGDTERHGIYRNIPYSYQAGTETYTAEVNSVLVTDEKGEPLPFGESRGNGELTLKIGDPDILVTGSHVYIISYIVKGPFLYFDEYDEFYWNVTGFWEAPIQQASVLVDLPPGAQVLTASCYKGIDGSNESCDSDERLVNLERAGYNAKAENLGIQEGLTVAVAFPKGSIVVIENAWEGEKALSPYDFWPFAIPLLVLLYMLHLWHEKGRDPKGRGSIVTQFTPPPDFLPSLAGVLYHEKVKGKEISAEIVRLAVEGYLRIHRFEKKILLFSSTDYLIERIGEAVPKDTLGALILKKLFQDEFMGEVEIGGETKKGVLVSKMAHKFVEEKKEIDVHMYTEILERKLFAERPDKVRLKYILIGLLGGAAGFGLTLAFATSIPFILFGSAFFTAGVVVAIMGNWMPVKTKEGVLLKEYLEGFKRYLSVAEKDRIDFHSSPDQDKAEPEKTMSLFDACLPYAIIFGVEEKWAEKFEDIYQVEPHWYSGGAGHAFAAGAFASDLSSFTADISTATAPQSSGAHGGGSSGGGFGGGGGGSW
ncbi:TPA: hypothetical protein DEP58_04215 [Patescibacteria group bacterium]|nr:hypothetical protein [Patescibacteria group bacterium]